MKGAVTTLVNPETQDEKDFAFDFSYWSHDGFEADDTGDAPYVYGVRVRRTCTAYVYRVLDAHWMCTA